jgi:hypothetical protein
MLAGIGRNLAGTKRPEFQHLDLNEYELSRSAVDVLQLSRDYCRIPIAEFHRTCDSGH